jgi:hypothetical protein
MSAEELNTGQGENSAPAEEKSFNSENIRAGMEAVWEKHEKAVLNCRSGDTRAELACPEALHGPLRLLGATPEFWRPLRSTTQNGSSGGNSL